MTRDIEDEIRDEKNPRPLDEDDIALLKTYVSLLSPPPIPKIRLEIRFLDSSEITDPALAFSFRNSQL